MDRITTIDLSTDTISTEPLFVGYADEGQYVTLDISIPSSWTQIVTTKDSTVLQIIGLNSYSNCILLKTIVVDNIASMPTIINNVVLPRAFCTKGKAIIQAELINYTGSIDETAEIIKSKIDYLYFR